MGALDGMGDRAKAAAEEFALKQKIKAEQTKQGQ